MYNFKPIYSLGLLFTFFSFFILPSPPPAVQAQNISQIPPNQFSTPPYGYWSFDDGQNPTNDDSGNGFHGTLVNGPTFTTTIPITLTTGQAIIFDGSDDYISLASTPNLANNSFTISFWAKHTANNVDDFIWAEEPSGSDHETLAIGFRSDNTFTCAFGNNDLNTTATYTDDEWHHWACSYDATTNIRTLYLDGVVVASDTAVSDYMGDGPYFIGRRNVGESFGGILDEVLLYNRPLIDAQMVWLANGRNNAPIALDDASRMFAISPFQNKRFEINPLTYNLIDDQTIYTTPGFTITGINGLAIHPLTGEIYAILKLSAVSGRVLATLDPETGVATTIGNLGTNFSNLAFTNEGVLYGVTGDGASPSETLFTINPATAARTLFMALGNGADGETIAFNPDDGLLYHSSGNSTPLWEAVNLNTLTVIPIVGNLGTGEIFSIRYIGNNTFLTTDINSSANLITTAGVVTSLPGALADDYRGMVYDGFTPYSTLEDTTLIVTATENHLLVNDFDGDFDPLTASLGTVTEGALVDLDSSGIFTYTPPLNFCGLDTFTYYVNDGRVNSNPGTVYIDVDCLPDAPLATDDVYTTTEDIPLVVPASGVLANDYDPDGPAVFTPTLLIPPAVGALQLNTDGSFSYTPTLNFNGVTTFTYQISTTTATTPTTPIGYWPFDDGSNPTSDVSGNGYDGTLVNAPVFTTTVPASYPGTAISFDGVDDRIDITGTITLANNSFTAAFWAKRTAINTTHTAIGHGVSSTNNNFLHIGFRSNNTFTCAFWNNDLNTTATYTDNDWHHWACTYDATTNMRKIYRDGLVVASGVAPADYQGSGPLTIGSRGTGEQFAGLLDEVRLYNSALSTAEINQIINTNSPTPDTDTATVILNITYVNDLPVAAGEAYTTTEDVPLVISAPGVLENDSDPVENSPLTSVLDSDVTNGSLVLNSDGSFVYTPTLNFNGSDSFTYHANDGQDDSEIVIVNLTILSDNDAPVVEAGSNLTTTEGITVTFEGSYTDPGRVLSGGDTILWDFGDSSTASGTLTPTHIFADNGVYTVTLTVTDSLGGVGTDFLMVTVNNAPPSLEAIANVTVTVGTTTTFATTYDDLGSADTQTVTVEWGDGVNEAGVVSSNQVSGSHIYDTAGVYTVTVTLADDDGGEATETFLVTVLEIPPTGFTLFLPLINRP